MNSVRTEIWQRSSGEKSVIFPVIVKNMKNMNNTSLLSLSGQSLPFSYYFIRLSSDIKFATLLWSWFLLILIGWNELLFFCENNSNFFILLTYLRDNHSFKISSINFFIYLKKLIYPSSVWLNLFQFHHIPIRLQRI